MDKIQPFQNNYPVLRNRLNVHIEKAKERNRSFTFPIVVEGYKFNITFGWENDKLIQSIIINPSGSKVHLKKLVLSFNNLYFSYWRQYLTYDFSIGSISISKFENSNSLKECVIDGVDNNIVISISDTNSDIKVFNVDTVYVDNVRGEVLNFNKVDLVKLSNYSGRVCRLLNCSRINVNHLGGSELKLSGNTLSGKIQHSKLDEFKLVESSFDIIEFVDFDIEKMVVEMPNNEGRRGNLKFTDSYLKELKIDKAIFGNPQWNFGFTYKTNDTKLKPIYLEILDSKFNPTDVDLNEVVWHYNGIVSNNQYPEGKRRLINLIKKFYVEKDDILNIQLQYAFEKKWYLENQSRSFPLILSRISNNFGLSLALPIFWIMLTGLLETSIILKLSHNCYLVLIDNWGIFFHLINPTHKTSLFVDILGDCAPPKYYLNLLPLIDNIGRILIGYSIFQFANAFRYKYKLR